MTHKDPVEAPRSHSPGPASSETPQDAREVERRERWAAWRRTVGLADESHGLNLLLANIGREQDYWVKRAVDAEAREARLRAGIERLAYSVERLADATKGAGGDKLRGAARGMRDLATPDADAQDEAHHA